MYKSKIEGCANYHRFFHYQMSITRYQMAIEIIVDCNKYQTFTIYLEKDNKYLKSLFEM